MWKLLAPFEACGLLRPLAPLQSLATEVSRCSPLRDRYDTFHGVQFPFSEISSSDRCRAGLPGRRLPFSAFLTLSTAWSRLNLVALFHATSARRIPGLQSLSAQPASVPLDPSYSLAVESVWHLVLPRHLTLLPFPSLRTSKKEAWTLDFRVLIRLGVRSCTNRFTGECTRCSLDLLPLQGLPARKSVSNLPSWASHARLLLGIVQRALQGI